MATRINDEVALLIATEDFVEREWLAQAAPVLATQALRASLSSVSVEGMDRRILRTTAETGLPWTLFIEPLSPDTEAIEKRERLWMGGFAVLATLSLTATSIVSRAVTRELAVARLQSDFVAAVSHEFRTPLTTMSQLTEVLIDGRAADDERRQSYYEALSRQTRRLRKLVEDLLDFARIETGKAPYRLETMDAVGWMRAVVEQFSADPASREHRLHLHVPEEKLTISADESALTHALWNLLDNAVKYSPDSSDVWVGLSMDGNVAHISVRDQGIGILRHERLEIFDRFVRGTQAKAARIKPQARSPWCRMGVSARRRRQRGWLAAVLAALRGAVRTGHPLRAGRSNRRPGPDQTMRRHRRPRWSEGPAAEGACSMCQLTIVIRDKARAGREMCRRSRLRLARQLR